MEGKARVYFCSSEQECGQLCRAEGHRGKEGSAAKSSTEIPHDAGKAHPGTCDRPGCNWDILEHRDRWDIQAREIPAAKPAQVPESPLLIHWPNRLSGWSKQN